MKLGIPRFGIYSTIMKSLLESLGHEVVMPAKITREMIKMGVANSSDMICFPFKTTLGQEIWALEQGATDLIMYNSCGLCRMKHYHQIQDLTLRKLGYSFTMHVVTRKNILKTFRQLGHISGFEAMRRMKGIASKIRGIDETAYRFSETRPLRIGIIGEIYTILEPDINFDIVRKLQRWGANVHISLTISDYLTENTMRGTGEDMREAKALLTQDLGGHGFQSIVNTIYYGKQGYDGVIHLLPLSCLPESTVEPLVDYVAEKYSIPLYRFPIDEDTFDAGISTRIETFAGMLKRKKQCQPI
ncbi:MAG: hypothetical protein Q8N42_02085 [bacterium]|nr:hypothetical protein [bacterium]